MLFTIGLLDGCTRVLMQYVILSFKYNEKEGFETRKKYSFQFVQLFIVVKITFQFHSNLAYNKKWSYILFAAMHKTVETMFIQNGFDKIMC